GEDDLGARRRRVDARDRVADLCVDARRERRVVDTFDDDHGRASPLHGWLPPSAGAPRERRERALELSGSFMDSPLDLVSVEPWKIRHDALAIGTQPQDVVLYVAW